MGRKTARAALPLTDEDKVALETLAGSRKAAVREVERAKVCLATQKEFRSAICKGKLGSAVR